MKKKDKVAGCGCLVVLVLIMGAYGLLTDPQVGNMSSAGAVWLLIGFFVLLFVIWMFSGGSSNCEVCGTELKRSRYRWKIGGKKQTVCPNCNSRLSRKASRDALDRRGL